eukprot:14191907-Heterocapsa_arctica.AAC.1
MAPQAQQPKLVVHHVVATAPLRGWATAWRFGLWVATPLIRSTKVERLGTLAISSCRPPST